MSTSPTDPEPRRSRRLFAAVIVLAAVSSLAVTALLINIFERKQEGKNPFYRVVELNDTIDDPATWAKNFPLQYDLYMRTVDMQRTKYGGSEAMPDCPIHAVLWSKTGAIRDLGTLPGDLLSGAVAINLFGKVVGTSGNSAVSQYYSSTGVGEGGVEVVGRAFIWEPRRGMRDLNMLIPVSDWVLNSVSDINVWGQIVGSGTLNGESHGFLLTPQ
ncbi:MAG: hypothetical protein ABSF15_24595 [Candidatus Sulfotelmatobacter sp.]|jgi:hypothetical protein